MRLRELAEKLGCRLVGDGEIDVRGLAPFDEAEDGDVTFVAHPRYLLELEASRASAVILKEVVPAPSKPTLLASNPYLAFVRALHLFYPPERPTPGVHPSTILGPGVRLAEGVSIGPLSYIEEGVVIGPRSAVGPQVYIGRGSSMGADCHVYPQVMIREGVQIAHNVTVGKDTVIAALTGISGSTKIGDRVTLAGQVGIVDHVTIGDDVTVGAQSGGTKDIPSGMVFLGSPAVPHQEFKRGVAAVNQFPRLIRQLHAIEARLSALEDAFQGRGDPIRSSGSSPEGGRS